MLEKLEVPPIVEVVCGIHFDEIGLDPVVLGGFWERRRKEYPKREIHHAIERLPGPMQLHAVRLSNTPGQLRTWLVSENDALVLQAQRDRFYLNWRSRGGPYPRFSSSDGLLKKMLREYGDFVSFCDTVLGTKLVPRVVELGKIDYLAQGLHWSDAKDLVRVLPILEPWLRVIDGMEPEVAMRVRDQGTSGRELTVSLENTYTFGPDAPEPIRGIKLETNLQQQLAPSDTIEDVFLQSNEAINEIFARLIPTAERSRRFSRRGRE